MYVIRFIKFVYIYIYIYILESEQLYRGIKPIKGRKKQTATTKILILKKYLNLLVYFLGFVGNGF